MRRFVLLFLVALLSLTSTEAKAQLVVSSFGCHTQVPCDYNSALFPPMHDFVANATSCAARYISAAPNTPVFNEILGLDVNGCLTTNPEAFPAIGSGPTIPRCCLSKAQGNSCTLQCSVVTQ
jgi:hypothetical protein